MKYAIFITGAAGAAKSTTARLLQDHYQILHRRAHIFNLDPACEYLPYQPSIDIREIVTVNEVQEFVHLGPNGALVYAFNFFFNNEREFLAENVDFEDDFLIFDCPGQIELYVQNTDLQRFAKQLQGKGYECVCLYLVEGQRLIEEKSFTTSILISFCVQLNLQLPFIFVATKCDLINKDEVEKMFEDRPQSSRFNQQLSELLTQVGSEEVVYLRYDDEEAIGELQRAIDATTHYEE